MFLIILSLLLSTTKCSIGLECPTCNKTQEPRCIGGQLIFDEKDKVCKLPTEEIRSFRPIPQGIFYEHPAPLRTLNAENPRTTTPDELIKQCETKSTSPNGNYFIPHPTTTCFKVIACSSTPTNGSVAFEHTYCSLNNTYTTILHVKISDNQPSYTCKVPTQIPEGTAQDQVPFCKDGLFQEIWGSAWNKNIIKTPCSRFEHIPRNSMADRLLAIAHPTDCSLYLSCELNSNKSYAFWPNTTFIYSKPCSPCKSDVDSWHCPEGLMYYDPQKSLCVLWSELSPKRRNQCALGLPVPISYDNNSGRKQCPKCDKTLEKKCIGGQLIYDEREQVCKLPTENIQNSQLIPREIPPIDFSWGISPYYPEITKTNTTDEWIELCKSNLRYTALLPNQSFFTQHPTMCFKTIQCLLTGNGSLSAKEHTCPRQDHGRNMLHIKISNNHHNFECLMPQEAPKNHTLEENQGPFCKNKPLPKVWGSSWDKTLPQNPCSKFESPSSINIERTIAHLTNCNSYYKCVINTPLSIKLWPNITFVELGHCLPCKREWGAWHCPEGFFYYDIQKSKCVLWSQLSWKRRTQCALGIPPASTEESEESKPPSEIPKITECPKCNKARNRKCIGGELIYDLKDQICKLPTEEIQTSRPIPKNAGNVTINSTTWSFPETEFPEMLNTNTTEEWAEYCKSHDFSKASEDNTNGGYYLSHPTMCFKKIHCNLTSNGTMIAKESTCPRGPEGKVMLHALINDFYTKAKCIVPKAQPLVKDDAAQEDSSEATICKEEPLPLVWGTGWDTTQPQHPCPDSLNPMNTLVEHPRDCTLFYNCVKNTPKTIALWPNVTFIELGNCGTCDLEEEDNWHCPEGVMYFDPENHKCVFWSQMSSKRRTKCALGSRDKSSNPPTECPKCNRTQEKRCVGGKLIYDEDDRKCKLPTEDIVKGYESDRQPWSTFPYSPYPNPEGVNTKTTEEWVEFCNKESSTSILYYLRHPTMCFKVIKCHFNETIETMEAEEFTCGRYADGSKLLHVQISVSRDSFECLIPKEDLESDFPAVERASECQDGAIPKVWGTGWNKTLPTNPCSEFESPSSMDLDAFVADPANCKFAFRCRINTPSSIDLWPNITFVEPLECPVCQGHGDVHWHCPEGHLYYDIDRYQCVWWSQLHSERRNQCALLWEPPPPEPHETSAKTQDANNNSTVL